MLILYVFLYVSGEIVQVQIFINFRFSIGVLILNFILLKSNSYSRLGKQSSCLGGLNLEDRGPRLVIPDFSIDKRIKNNVNKFNWFIIKKNRFLIILIKIQIQTIFIFPIVDQVTNKFKNNSCGLTIIRLTLVGSLRYPIVLNIIFIWSK